ncbi:ribosomal protein S18 acetylase RimI-like enzyme [Caldalkalibacillus uzonensis]|uniref:Ribosomal protein S18 acetylase RimI-like enzyme n=1 Tax=Caldalkalibacillus uzonensis TaxID=353224 RepID=A0ABU0CSF0_9BACI|nr:ribosomal protein S18 acetylase RimI-like enzyme [Caldalkalibacillus uzonensis]
MLFAFIIGFVSQSEPNEAYIHFVGVHPQYRKQGLARKLYTTFMDTVRRKGCQLVRCITSPVNKTSILFHTRMGFEIEPGDDTIAGLPVHRDYDGVGVDRVLFVKRLH